MKKTATIFAFILTGFISRAQLPDRFRSEKVTLSIRNKDTRQAFDMVAKKTSFRFCYSPADIDRRLLLTFDFNNESLEKVLDKITRLAGLQFKLVNRYICVFKQPAK